jgi:type IV pilus assembly protein PilQ
MPPERGSGSVLGALLHFLKSTSDTKTLASPRLMVINGQRARLQVGEQLGYKVIAVTETVSVEEVKFLDVGVVLDVMPRISRDGRILLRVEPKVSAACS